MNRSRRSRFLLAAALLAAVTAAVYAPVLRNEFVNFDDDTFIYENELLLLGVPEVVQASFQEQLFTPYYKPLVYLSWAAEARLFGLAPWAFHLDNLLLHLANALLVLGLARALFARDRWPLAQALLVAALFALHPLRVEAVAWATARKDVLSGFFYLLALAAWVAFRRRGRPLLRDASALAFLAAVLSKSMAVTLPAALVLVDFVLGIRPGRRQLAELRWHGAVLLLAALLYGLVPGVVPDRDLDAGPEPAGVASTETEPVTLRAREATVEAGRSLSVVTARYLGFARNLVAPRELAVIYPVPRELAHPDPLRAALAAGFWVALAGALVVSLRFGRRVAAAVGFYSLTLAPVLAGPSLGTNYLSDRYTYLPSLGLAVLVALGAAAVARRWPKAAALAPAGATLYLLFLAVSSHLQIAVWRDSLSLWNRVIETQPPVAIAFNNRALALQARGEPRAALADLDRAAELEPGAFQIYNNLATVRFALGELDAARRDLDRAIGLRPAQPELFRNRGLVRDALGEHAAAVVDYSRALTLEPRRRELLLLRGVSRREAGDAEGAILDLTLFLRTAERARELREAYEARAIARMDVADFEGAIADNTHALELDPGSAPALNNRGRARFYLGRLESARRDFDAALRHRPGYALAYRNRGDALAALGELAAGCEDWRRAARLSGPEESEAERRLQEFCR